MTRSSAIFAIFSMQPDLDEVVVTADPLPVGHLATRVVCPTAGAIATFVGTTRDNFEGKRVLKLEVCAGRPQTQQAQQPTRAVCMRAQYEAYVPMAEREMHAIIQKARKRWTLRHVAMAHRIGVVPTAESSVEIAISSTHRKEALAAVQFAIDELKAQARHHPPPAPSHPSIGALIGAARTAGAHLEEGGLRRRRRRVEGE